MNWTSKRKRTKQVQICFEWIDKIHESTESDINGELKLVIKSNF